ncbi:MAG: YihY/virulence factor BrkB family protein [Haloarculaceae archaeon]
MRDSPERSPSYGRPLALGRVVLAHALATDVPFMAGAIAYQAFVSLLPLLFLLVVVATAIGGQRVTDHLLAITAEQLPRSAQGLVREAVRTAVANTGNSLVGVVVLGFGAVAVFSGLDKAFTDLYDVDRGTTLPNQLRDAGLVLGALALSTLAIAAAWTLVVLPVTLPLGGLLRPVALALGLIVAFYPAYHVFPEVPLGWREVLPGVALAAVGWTVLQALFRLYVRFVARSGAFGAVSGVLVLATWLYFSAVVVLVGGALNAVLHGVEVAD